MPMTTPTSKIKANRNRWSLAGGRLCLALGFAAWLIPAAPLLAKGPVSLEIAMERGVPLTASKDWYDLLTSLGVTTLRIRSASEGDRVSVEDVGRKDAPSYEVHAVLKANNVLMLPGGSFTSRDRTGLKKWLDTLADGGKNALPGAGGGERTPFGLTPKELAAVNDDLSKPILFETSGLTVSDLLAKVRPQRVFPLAIQPGASQRLEATKITEDFKGLSTGVALAIALRPAGLALGPERSGASLQYRVGKTTGGEIWPAGWTPQQPNAKVFPKMFESIEVEISDTALPEAIDAIAERMETPFFFDHNALALHGVEPAKTLVTLPAKKLTYSQILQKILFQARLKPELRTDDAGKPFIWITTIKPAP
jgi:hypothetical protein